MKITIESNENLKMWNKKVESKITLKNDKIIVEDKIEEIRTYKLNSKK